MENLELPATESELNAFHDIPLTALSRTTLQALSQLLCSVKILRTADGYERDWRGLASLAKQKFDSSDCREDPLKRLIQLWCTNNPTTATFGYLQQYLKIIDRQDVCDDLYEHFVEDGEVYRQNQPSELSLLLSDNIADTQIGNLTNNFGYGSNSNILTISDVERAQNGLSPQMYDAFLLYADSDLKYALEILTKLEVYNIKLCTKNRDLLAGVEFEHVALIQLIEQRCRHLIVILTEEFFKSPENEFLVNYTQALQIQHKTRKIIPLLYENQLNIPRTLKIYRHLYYVSENSNLYNFWDKLAYSVRNVNVPMDIKTAKTLSYKTDTSYTPTDSSKGITPRDGELYTSQLSNNESSIPASKQKRRRNLLKKFFKS